MTIEVRINSTYEKRHFSPACNLLPFQNICFKPLFRVNITLEKSFCVCHQLSQITLTSTYTKNTACSFQENIFLNIDPFLSLYKVLPQN